MGSRIELHQELVTLLGSDNVYFQPPASIQMHYDAIIYNRRSIDNRYANNSVYKQNHSYELVAIYEDPDSDLPIKLSQFPMCKHDRHYVADNLNHDAFTLYY